MLDRLRIMVPFKPEYVTGGQAFLTAAQAIRAGHKGILYDIFECDVPVGARAVALADCDDILFKDWQIDEAYHPFESLESHFTPLAFKVYDRGNNNYPYIELKFSPAKLLQGHNIFGPVDISIGSIEGLATLLAAYPKLYSMIEIEAAEVWELDCTFSARMRSDNEALQVFNFLRNVSYGQTKVRGSQYESTINWMSPESKLKRLKAYLKSHEFAVQLKDYKKKAESGDLSAQRVYKIMSDPRLTEWAIGLIRFESTVCKKWLLRRGMPVLLTELINLQRDYAAAGRCLITELWQETTADIFKAFEGQTMRVTDDESVLKKLEAVHFSITPKGNVSYTKANKLMLFFIALRESGYASVKKMHNGNQTFYRHIKDLEAAGFSKAFLQNLHGERVNNIVPMLRFLEVDFGSQRPDWYMEPVSQFIAA